MSSAVSNSVVSWAGTVESSRVLVSQGSNILLFCVLQGGDGPCPGGGRDGRTAGAACGTDGRA